MRKQGNKVLLVYFALSICLLIILLYHILSRLLCYKVTPITLNFMV